MEITITDKTTFAEAIRVFRAYKNLTQKDAATHFGLKEHSTTICNWEKGKTTPTKNMEKRILLQIRTELNNFDQQH